MKFMKIMAVALTAILAASCGQKKNAPKVLVLYSTADIIKKQAQAEVLPGYGVRAARMAAMPPAEPLPTPA